jgi:acetamidase/formamidase
MPGDVLELRILEVNLAVPYGYNRQRPYTGALPDEFPALWQRVIQLNRAAKTAEVVRGVVVPLDHPFFGTMGVAPDPTMGRISSSPPGIHTGNIDNKDLVAGTILYMPVHAPGALFSVGDGHAAQGQGEVDLSAIETGLRGKFQFIVHKDMKLTWPRAETPTHWIVMGLHPNLEEAMKIAVRETITFMTSRFPKLTREEAYMIASIAVDYQRHTRDDPQGHFRGPVSSPGSAVPAGSGARPACRSDAYNNGARSTSSMRAPQGSVI